MAQRVNLSPIGLPVQKKTFIAKTAAAVVILVRETILFDLYIDQSRSNNIHIDQKREFELYTLN